MSVIQSNPEQEGDGAPMSIKKDYTIDVYRLLDNLKEQIENMRAVGNITFGLSKNELVFQIEKIKASMPREMKDAATLAKESERMIEHARQEGDVMVEQGKREADRILQEASAEAARILKQAELDQERMVNEAEVLKIAKAQSDEILVSADKESRAMRRGADEYARNVLNKLETVVTNLHTQIERGKSELEAVEREGTRERIKA